MTEAARWFVETADARNWELPTDTRGAIVAAADKLERACQQIDPRAPVERMGALKERVEQHRRDLDAARREGDVLRERVVRLEREAAERDPTRHGASTRFAATSTPQPSAPSGAGRPRGGRRWVPVGAILFGAAAIAAGLFWILPGAKVPAKTREWAEDDFPAPVLRRASPIVGGWMIRDERLEPSDDPRWSWGHSAKDGPDIGFRCVQR